VEEVNTVVERKLSHRLFLNYWTLLALRSPPRAFWFYFISIFKGKWFDFTRGSTGIGGEKVCLQLLEIRPQ
jgi:hypothetical protein